MWMVPVAMAAGSMLMNNQQRQQTNDYNKAQAKMAAAQTQFSPWTKMGAGQANFDNSAKSNAAAGLQGGMAGLSMAQNYNQAQGQSNLAQEQANFYKSQQASPWINNAKLVGNQHQMAGGYSGMMG